MLPDDPGNKHHKNEKDKAHWPSSANAFNTMPCDVIMMWCTQKSCLRHRAHPRELLCLLLTCFWHTLWFLHIHQHILLFTCMPSVLAAPSTSQRIALFASDMFLAYSQVSSHPPTYPALHGACPVHSRLFPFCNQLNCFVRRFETRSTRCNVMCNCSVSGQVCVMTLCSQSCTKHCSQYASMCHHDMHTIVNEVYRNTKTPPHSLRGLILSTPQFQTNSRMPRDSFDCAL